MVDGCVRAVVDAGHVWTHVDGGDVWSDMDWWGVGSDMDGWCMRRNIRGVLVSDTTVEMSESTITTTNTASKISGVTSEITTTNICSTEISATSSVATAAETTSTTITSTTTSVSTFVSVTTSTVTFLGVLGVRVFDNLQLRRSGFHFHALGTGSDDQLWWLLVYGKSGLRILIGHRVPCCQGHRQKHTQQHTHRGRQMTRTQG